MFGRNDMREAKAARVMFEYKPLPKEDFTIEWMVEYQLMIIDEVAKWSEQNEYINVAAFSASAWAAMFKDDLVTDLVLMAYAMVLVTTYSTFVLGGCSPIHMRSSLALFGLLSVILSVTSGYGISFFFGLKISEMHSVLPFMILGIGVDDMFVITNCVD